MSGAAGGPVRDGPVWLVGAGNMGGAMLRGWIAAGRDPRTIVVIDPGAADMPAGVLALPAPPPDGAAPAVLVLAVKPQLLDRVAPALAPMLAAETLLVSILAGVEIASLKARFAAPETIVRCMPNLPAAIGRGVTALYSPRLTRDVREVATGLVAPLGDVEWIDEEGLFDAVTALSGCGPAFLFRFVEAMAAAGEELGLPADQAARLALATVAGSATMAAGADEPPATLADRVASPGGSTREGLNVLDADGAIMALMRRTLAASARRNAELAAAAR
ncbi:pyrroline-5-carboxylate reductase [Sphingomonas profundi]|uniref:pyrroline-5-carboxylate reductase n=1 Tax=Alterirhizorhabdus profundi TaxID=2681549 RepID=UPI002411487E|nr:pyrroline-5-carboxylate reductase [Sphingomonas profundi]